MAGRKRRGHGEQEQESGKDPVPGTLVLIDGNSLLYRAFFALPPLTDGQGRMTNAAYGFASMLFKILDEERPDMMAVAFDLPTPTFRHERFPEYKANRAKMPDELAPQITMAREILGAMGIPAYELEGYEADDVIGTLSLQGERAGHRVLVVTGDLDALQLVSDRVSVMVTRRGISDTKVYDEKAVEDRYGFTPEKLADFRALRGDASDNIPGVPGIGEKTASRLIQRFGSLEQVLEHLDEVTPPRVSAAVEAYAELARRDKELSLLVRDLPILFDPKALRCGPPDEQKLSLLFRELDFRSLLRRVAGNQEEFRAAHRRLEGVREVRALAREFAGADRGLVVHPMAEEGSPLRVELLGLSLLAVSSAANGGATSTAGEPAVLIAKGAELDRLLAPLRPVLESPSISKTGHDLKRAALLLSRHGIALQGMSFDAMIASHLLNPAHRSHHLGAAILEHLESGTGTQLKLGEGDDADAAAVAVMRIAALRERLEKQLDEAELGELFRELEMPLVPVLTEMELTGVAVNVPVLEALSARLGEKARGLEQEIHSLAGEEFNISSPKQLRHILFEKLGLPPDKTRRTKTGYSTDAEVLAGLSEFEIVGKILEYREVTKLKSTYVDTLPQLVDPQTGRVHTSFNQAVTATGRLSSSEPNLQNIPIRSELGMEIRRALVPGLPDHVLLSGDYSQIELRILAHITEDENLIQIFLRDEDLHRAAAAEIFGVEADQVSPRMRSFAKMVNFGIPYGISDFRLAREMGITQEEARRYMDRYFARFPRLHAYVEEAPKKARTAGHVTTLLGRRRPLPELRARVPSLRQAAERMAVNTPMQGSAADIMKLAMLAVHDQLNKRGLGASMILQVHDELLLDVPRSRVEETASLVRACMAGAYELRVPLKVDIKAGVNWLDMAPVE